MNIRAATATDLKNRLGVYLKRVRAGQSLLITDRGRPIGRLIPEGGIAEEPLIARLMARGLLTPPKGRGELPRRVRSRGPLASETIVAERRR